ncbi:MAG: transcriptional regulator GlxA family with amidase domain, partial [Limisphaerales bacterium]
LRDTDLPIEAIAEQTGFVHSHYLQATFKQRRGETPGAYRKRFVRIGFG